MGGANIGTTVLGVVDGEVAAKTNIVYRHKPTRFKSVLYGQRTVELGGDEESGIISKKLGDKSTWINATIKPTFKDITIGQSVFHTENDEFGGDEFGDNFRNLGLDIGDLDTDIRSGLLKSKYYIKGKAEEKFLAPKGGHRIGIGTDLTGIGKLIAISAINYKHPTDQWPSTPGLKPAYGGGLVVQAYGEVEDEEQSEDGFITIEKDTKKYTIRKISYTDTTTGISLDKQDNEYSLGAKYGNIPSSNQYWPNVLNPEVPEKPNEIAADEVKANFLTLSEGVGAPPDNRRFRLGTMGSHLSTSGKDFVKADKRVLDSMKDGSGETWNITTIPKDNIPIAIAKTSYIHKHWPSGVVNRFSQTAAGVHHITKTSNDATEDATKGVFNDSPYGTIILTPTYEDTTTGISVFRNNVFAGDGYDIKIAKRYDTTHNNLKTNFSIGNLPGSLGGGLLNTGVVAEDAVEAIPDDNATKDVNEKVDAKDEILYKPGLIGTTPFSNPILRYRHPDGQWPSTVSRDGDPKFPANIGGRLVGRIKFTDSTTGQKVFNIDRSKPIIFKGDLYGPGKLDSGEVSYSKYQKSTGTFVSKLQQYFMTIPTTSNAPDIAARYRTIGDDDSLHKKTLKLGVGKFEDSLNDAETGLFESEFIMDSKSKVSEEDQLANKLKEVRPAAKTYPTYLEPGRYTDHTHLGEPGTLVTKVQGFEGFYSGLLHKKDEGTLRASSVITTDVDDPNTKEKETARTPENKEYVHHNSSAIKGYAVLSYGMIPGGAVSDPNDDRYEHGLRSPSELVNKDAIFDKQGKKDKKGNDAIVSSDEIKAREKGKQRIYSLGQQGLPGIKPEWSNTLGGLIKKSDRVVDKINILPYGGEYGTTTVGEPGANTELIPFRFRDAVNGKWIIFRAILGAITDTVTADWAEEKYVGRPEQVYVYQGAGREVSFAFDIYPTTRQELPVLWEKLNYLVGLCYPSYYSRSGDTGGGDIMSGRMVGPWIYLTIGDMFENSPGFLTGVTVTTGDETTWETDGTQLPKHITVDCTFKYIGNHQLMTTGKHYNLPGMNGNKAFGNYATSPQGQLRPDVPKLNNTDKVGANSLKSYVTKQ